MILAMIGKGKRPRDPNQHAAWTVAVSTGQIPLPEAPQPKPDRSPVSADFMASIGRKGGQIGGKRRLTTMTAEQRQKVARKAAKARWKQAKKSSR